MHQQAAKVACASCVIHCIVHCAIHCVIQQAVKVAYASWTKGSSALLLAVHSFAQEHGVHDALMDEWGRSQKALLARSKRLGRVAPKAWRFVGMCSVVWCSPAGVVTGSSGHAGASFRKCSIAWAVGRLGRGKGVYALPTD